MGDIKSTQESRQSIYGDYKGGARLRAQIMESILERYNKIHGPCRMPVLLESYIWDVVNKLTRIAVTPTHIDSWHDLSSYANLVEKALKGEDNATVL